ncbi:MAG: hypothetical protein PWP65_407 [Clostridia bacterium]|nr:hypothetical protein [Clostridia bacterium]
MNRRMQVGFSQRIQLEWLEYTVDLVLAGYSRSEIEAAVQELLKNRLSRGGTAQSCGSHEKAITILLKIWAAPPAHLEELRGDGLELLRVTPKEQHLTVHWGMTMAVYPFLRSWPKLWGGFCACRMRFLRLRCSIGCANSWAKGKR